MEYIHKFLFSIVSVLRAMQRCNFVKVEFPIKARNSLNRSIFNVGQADAPFSHCSPGGRGKYIVK